MADQQMMKYFKFDQEDLEANRRGQLTEKQKARLIQKNTRNGILLGILLLLGAGGLASTVYWDLRTPTYEYKSIDSVWSGLVPLLSFGFGVYVLLRPRSEPAFQLASAKGTAKFSYDMVGTFPYSTRARFLNIGEKKFRDAEFTLLGHWARMKSLFLEGKDYSVYYVGDRDPKIVSAEIVEK